MRAYLRKHRLIILAGLFIIISLGAWTLQATPTEPIDSYAQCVEAGYPVANSEPSTCSDGHRTFIGPFSSPLPSSLPAVTQAFELLVTGDSHNMYPHRQQTITSQAQWQTYWQTIHASINPIPPLLSVDFKTSNVIALNLGSKNTGGHTVKVTSIQTSSLGTVVAVTETSPGASCATTQALTNPYYLVRTPILPEPVTFRITATQRDCTSTP